MGSSPPFAPSPITVGSRDGTSIALFQALPPDGTRLDPEWTDRRAVLLVHGATADHTTWRAVGPMLAVRRPVFAIDRRGRGRSGDGGPYSIEREYEDVAVAVDELRQRFPPTVDVVGHSYGGRVALGAARVVPIGRVVCYEGAPVPPGMSYRPPGLVAAVRAALGRGDREAALSTFLAGIVGMSESALAAYRADPVWPARVAAAHTILREIEAEASPAASLEALRGVANPVLLILGSISRSPFRIGTDELASRLPDARVAVIDGAAHAAHHTHAPEFVRIVEAFLDAPATDSPLAAASTIPE